jgi:hypothetical protein
MSMAISIINPLHEALVEMKLGIIRFILADLAKELASVEATFIVSEDIRKLLCSCVPFKLFTLG